MRKLRDDEIPENVLLNSLEQKEKLAKEIGVTEIKRTQMYTIPAYTKDVLLEAESIAKKIKEFGIRMNAISRDVILEMFGLAKAKEVYPQVKSESVTKTTKEFSKKVEWIVVEHIKHKGFSRLTEIIKELQHFHNWKTLTDKRIKKCIPGIMARNNLKECVANKKLKAKYKIDSNGYPRIIVKKEAA